MRIPYTFQIKYIFMFARSQRRRFFLFLFTVSPVCLRFYKKENYICKRLFKTKQFFRDVYLSKLIALLDVKASFICSGRKDFGGTWQPKVNILFGKSTKSRKLLITFLTILPVLFSDK
jgi:hypothetical protein